MQRQRFCAAAQIAKAVFQGCARPGNLNPTFAAARRSAADADFSAVQPTVGLEPLGGWSVDVAAFAMHLIERELRRGKLRISRKARAR